MKQFESRLRELKLSLSNPNGFPSSEDSSLGLGDSISDPPHQYKGLIASQFFNDRDGALFFCEESLRLYPQSKAYLAARKNVYTTTLNLVSMLGKTGMEEYGYYVWNKINRIFRVEQDARAKSSALDTNFRLLKQGLDCLQPEKIEVIKVFGNFMKELRRIGNSGSSGVKGIIMEFLGKLCETYPKVLEQKFVILKKFYITTLNEQARQRQPKIPIIGSCMQGLTYFLNKFGDTISEDDELTMFKLYNYMSRIFSLNQETRYQATLAALNLLRRHSSHFKKFIMGNIPKISTNHTGQGRYKETIKAIPTLYVFQNLAIKASHANDNVRRRGIQAMTQFLSQLSDGLINDEEVNVVHNSKIFDGIINHIKRMFMKEKLAEDTTNPKMQKVAAITALGMCGAMFSFFRGEAHLKGVLTNLLQHSENHLKEEYLTENSKNIPYFLTAFANVIINMKEIDIWILDKILSILQIQLRVWVKLNLFAKAKWMVCRSILMLFTALSFKKDYLKNVLDGFSTYSLTAATAQLPVLQTFAREDNLSLHDTFADLWNILFNPDLMPNSIEMVYPWNKLDINEKIKNGLYQTMYDSAMKTFLSFISKYNLSLREKNINQETTNTQEEENTEEKESNEEDEDLTFGFSDASNLTPVNQTDFDNFLELVKFQLLFLHSRHHKLKLFEKWIDIFIDNVIQLSLKNPLISSFFKLLKASLVLVKRIGYFKKMKFPEDDKMIVDTGSKSKPENESKVACFKLIQKYCDSCIDGLEDIFGELLVAQLEFLCEIPFIFVNKSKIIHLKSVETDFDDNELEHKGVSKFIIPLRKVMRMGLSYLPLATTGLNCLEYWVRNIPDEETENFLRNILPEMDVYLIGESEKEGSIENEVKLSSEKRKVQKIDFKKKLERQRTTKRFFSKAELLNLRNIQIRIIRLLGKFGGKNFEILKEKDELKNVKTKEEEIEWSSKKTLQCVLSFPNIQNVQLFFDEVVRKAAILADNSADRRVKFAAGEFLHSMILYLIGRSAQDPNKSVNKTNDHFDNFRKLFPIILRLAVDTENSIKQLYNPLVFQLVHWFTQNRDIENKETKALLDAIIKGTQHQKNSELRELSAELMYEFFRWSIKHQTGDEIRDRNTSTILEELKENVCHPDRYKRLGAILCYNKIYKELREHDWMVRKYTLSILKNVMQSLSIKTLSNEEEGSMGLMSKIKSCLRHYIRIVRYKANILNKKKTENERNRRNIMDLQDFVEWCFKHIGNENRFLRQHCMYCFRVCCRKLKNFETVDGQKRWIKKMISKSNVGVNFVTNALEGGGLSEKTTVNGVPTKDDTNEIKKFSAMIDAYCWIFHYKFITPHEVYSFGSIIEKCVNFCQKRITEKNTKAFLSLFNFISINLEKYKESFLEIEKGKIINNNLLKKVIIGILMPEKNGFDISEESVRINIQKILGRLVSSLSKVSDEVNLKLTKLSSALIGKIDFLDLKMSLTKTFFLCVGYYTLDSLKLIKGGHNLDNMSKKLFTNMEKMTPKKIAHYNNLWGMIFRVGFNGIEEKIIRFLRDNEVVNDKMDVIDDDDDDDDKVMEDKKDEKKTEELVTFTNRGEMFYVLFKSEILRFILLNFETFSKLLFGMIKESRKFPFFIRILSDLSLVKENDIFNLEIINKFVNNLMENATILEEKFKEYYSISSQKNTSQGEDSLNKTIDVPLLILRIITQVFKLGTTFISAHKNISCFVNIIIIAAEKIGNTSSDSGLELKTMALRMFPNIFPIATKKVLETIDKIVLYEFPLDYNELHEESREYQNHLKLMRLMFDILSKCNSIELFERLIPLYRWTNHPISSEITTNLEDFLKGLNEGEKLKISTFCIEKMMNTSIPKDIRISAIDWICINCIQLMEKETKITFFGNNFENFDRNMRKKFNNEQEFVTIYCNMGLLEALFRTLTKEEAKQLRDDKKLLGMFKGIYGQKIRVFNSSEKACLNNNKELIRNYYQRTYNALAGATYTTQDKENIFCRFLFDESKKKIWDTLIDTETELSFPVEVDFELHHNIIDNLTQCGRENKTKRKPKKGILQSGFFYRSQSLEFQESITESGSFSIAGTFGSEISPINLSFEPMKNFDANKEDTIAVHEEVLSKNIEMDIINKHPCMATILRVIDHMVSNLGFISDRNMPVWMNCIKQSLERDDNALNVKIFLTKIILNRPDLFKPFAANFFPSLVEIVINCKKETGFNYFVRDVFIMLIRWDFNASQFANTRKSANILIDHMFKECFNKRGQILRDNIKIISIFLDKFKDFIMIRNFTLLGWLTSYNKKFTKKDIRDHRDVGLQILGALLGVGLSIYNPVNPQVNEEKFYSLFLRVFDIDSLKVQRLIPDVCGLYLQHLKPEVLYDSEGNKKPSILPENKIKATGANYDHSYNLFHTLLTKKIKTFLEAKKIERFLKSLIRIGTNYPSFLRPFLGDVFKILPNCYGSNLQIALQILSWSAESINDLHKKMLPYYRRFLSSNDESTHILTLDIFLKKVSSLEKEEIIEFLKLIEELKSIENETFGEKARLVYYNILVKIYDNKIDLREDVIVKDALLSGMSDSSSIIRAKIIDFFNTGRRLSNIALDRMAELFSKIYSKNLKDQKWLNVASHLMLKLLEDDANYNETPIFETPLAKCDFVEQDVDTSYMGSLQSLAPSFGSRNYSMTLGSYEGSDTLERTKFQKRKGRVRRRKKMESRRGLVLSTQRLFPQTQVENEISSFTQPNFSQGSLAFYSPSFKPFGSKESADPSFIEEDKTETSSNTKKKGRKRSVHDLQRRFRPSDDSQAIHMRYARKKKWEKQAKMEESRQRRMKEIRSLRTYRKGELPDICIPPKAIWDPLQALTLMDSSIARELFLVLFEEFFGKGEREKNRRWAQLRATFQEGVLRMLINSKSNSVLVSSVFSMCLKFDILLEKIEPETISSASLRSYTIETGVILLEKYIQKLKENIKTSMDIDSLDDFTVQSNQNVGTSPMTPVTMQSNIKLRRSWVELSKMYRVLGYQDAVMSIYEHHISQSKITKEGLKKEMSGSFIDAAKIYESGLKKWRGEEEEEKKILEKQIFEDGETTLSKPTDTELEFWERQLINCHFNNIGDEMVLKLLESSEKDVWDEYEFYLPIFLESQLRVNAEKLEWFINENLKKREYQFILESKFADVLASLCLVRGHLEKSKGRVFQGYDNFLRDWAAFQNSTVGGKYLFLQKLQRFVEIEEYLYFRKKSVSVKEKIKYVSRLLLKWEKRHPNDYRDNPQAWRKIIFNREIILKNILDYFRKNYDKIIEGLESEDIEDAAGLSFLDGSTDGFISMNTLGTEDIDDGITMSLGSEMPQFSLHSIVENETNKQEGVKINLGKLEQLINMHLVRINMSACHSSLIQRNVSSSLIFLTNAKNYSDKMNLQEGDELREEFSYEFSKQVFQTVITRTEKSPLEFLSGGKEAKLVQLISRIKESSEKEDLPWDKKLELKMIEGDVHYLIYDKMKQFCVNEVDGLGEVERVREIKRVLDEVTGNLKEIESRNQDEDAKKLKIFKKKAYYEYAIFANKLTQNKLIDQLGLNPGRFFTSAVYYCIKSIEYDNRRVKELFPICLEIIQKYEQSRSIFKKCLNKLPKHILFYWFSQMCPHLGGKEGECLLDVMEYFARNFPQGIMYPVNVVFGDIVPGSDRIEQTMKLVKHLVVKKEMLDFIEKVEWLHSPTLRFTDNVSKLTKVTKKGVYNNDEMVRMWNEIYEKTFNEKSNEMRDAGKIHKDYCKHFKTYAKLLCGVKGSKITSNTISKIYKELKGPLFRGKGDKKKGIDDFSIIGGWKKMEYYSRGLKNWEDENAGSWIEVPGQYEFMTSLSGLDPEKHCKIVGFGENILVLGSIRKPKMIEIIASDEKSYKFLAKLGEDLRQDARIQQLFSVFEAFFKADENCQKKGLANGVLKTYRVIPLSKNCGVIEWIENSETFKGFAQLDDPKKKDILTKGVNDYRRNHHLEYVKNYEAKGSSVGRELRRIHKKYYGGYRISHKVSNISGVRESLLATYFYNDKAIKDLVLNCFNNKECSDRFLFRDSLLKLSDSISKFFGMKKLFGMSYSAICICGFLLGIGDRHLDNTMVDIKSGKCVAIDFGHAFGSATEKLPLPELLPFRLSRNIVSIFEPRTRNMGDVYEEQKENVFNLCTTGGVFVENMVATMDCLVKNKVALKSILNIFIQEPLVDWMEKINRRKVENDMEEEDEVGTKKKLLSSVVVGFDELKSKFFPEKKISLCFQKLELINPVVPIITDLKSNPHIASNFFGPKNRENLQKLIIQKIIGDRKYNSRANVDVLNAPCKDTRQFVEFLIDLATDVQILGRTYYGWSPTI